MTINGSIIVEITSTLILLHLVGFMLFGRTGASYVFKYTIGLLGLGIAPLMALVIRSLAHAILAIKGKHPRQMSSTIEQQWGPAPQTAGEAQSAEAETTQPATRGRITTEAKKTRVINTASGLKNPFSPEKGFGGDYRQLIRERYKSSHREAIHKLVNAVQSGRHIHFKGPWAEEATEIMETLIKVQPQTNVVHLSDYRREEAPEIGAAEDESWLNQEPPAGSDEYFAEQTREQSK